MKAAVYDAPGGPHVLDYRDVADPVCPVDGVVLRVQAISIEGGDLINRASTPPPGPGYVPGYAAAGEIIAVGAQVRDRAIGQKVASFDMGGSHAALRAVPASRTWLLPDSLDMAAAAALPISFGTAYHALFTRGGLTRGETVLVQGGAGGVGVAAIQLARQAGATVIATVSGPERVARLAALGLTHAVDHRTTDVVARVLELTEGRGVDMVLDPVGSTLGTSLHVLRPEGRLVFVGNAGREALHADLWPALQGNQTLMGVFMGTQLEKPQVHADVARLLAQAAQGALEVPVARRFALSEAATAHAYAENESFLGRVVLVP